MSVTIGSKCFWSLIWISKLKNSRLKVFSKKQLSNFMFPHTFLPQSLFNLTEWAQVCIQTTEQAWSFRLWQFLHSNLCTYYDVFCNLATFTIVKNHSFWNFYSVDDWLKVLLSISWNENYNFQCNFRNIMTPKNSESAAAYYCLASFLIQDQISAQATQKILTKNGRWTCFETCHFRINVHNRYVYLHIWKHFI